MKYTSNLLALVAFGALLAPAQAGIFYQSIPDMTVAPSLPGVCSTCSGSSDQWVGEKFSLTSTETVASVSFTAGPQYWPAGSVTLSFFKNFGYYFGSYLLGDQLYSQSFSAPYASDQLLGTGPYLVSINLGGAGLTLTPGDYLIFITNPVDLGLPAYSNLGAGDGVYVDGLLEPGAAYLPEGSGRDWAVALSNSSVGSVPEPSVWAMMTIGFAGLGYVGSRRRVPAPQVRA
jgi:hypothetical protein